jgi:hypothetical protein
MMSEPLKIEFECFPVGDKLPSGPLWLYFPHRKNDKWQLCDKWKNALGKTGHGEFQLMDGLGRWIVTTRRPTHYAYAMPNPEGEKND